METISVETAPGVRAVELDVPGMDTALRHVVPAETGHGDFWIAVRSAANGWTFALGEVSERGRPAATLAARDAIRTAARQDADVVSALGLVNRWLSDRYNGQRTMSLALARLELDRCGTWVSLACGGSGLPVLIRRAGWVDLRGQRGPLLGTLRDTEFREDRVGLGPGDALVFASDAVMGALDEAGEAFAQEALQETLLAVPGRPAATLADRVVDAAAAHVGGRLPDNTVVVVLRVPHAAGEDPDAWLRGALGSYTASHLPGYPVGQPHWGAGRRAAPPREARMLLPPTNAAVPAGRRFSTSVLHSWRLSELVDGGDVELITSELVGNAVRHGRRDITVLVSYDGTRVRVAVGDGSRELPRSRDAGTDDVDGRGLLIIEALSADFGVSPTIGGKRVWAEVDAPAAAP